MSDTEKGKGEKGVTRVVQPLHPRFFSLAEHVRTVYSATVPAGVAPDDLMNPLFWAHLASKLRPADRIEVDAEDGSYFAELRVQHASRTEARVVLLQVKRLQTALPGENDLLKDYEVSHTPATNWRVVRKSDRRTLVEMLKDRGEAITWLASHVRQNAA